MKSYSLHGSNIQAPFNLTSQMKLWFVDAVCKHEALSDSLLAVLSSDSPQDVKKSKTLNVALGSDTLAAGFVMEVRLRSRS